MVPSVTGDICYVMSVVLFFFFKQKTAYDMRISDWSSDVCSSDLVPRDPRPTGTRAPPSAPSANRLRPRRSGPAPTTRERYAEHRWRHRVELPDSTSGSHRSEERRVGKECVRTCRSRGSPAY